MLFPLGPRAAKGGPMYRPVFLAIAVLASSAVTQSPNPNTPSGTQGHDWDVAAFRLESGHVAVVTAVNVSNAGNSSSTTGFEVWLDGTRIDNFSTQGLVATKAYAVLGPDRHNVFVRCTNHIATMVSCR